MRDISTRIKNYRTLRNLSQRALAEKLDKSVNTIANWERGLSCPDVNSMLDLCSVLQITPNELLGWEDNQEYTDFLIEVDNARILYEQARQDREEAAKRMKAYADKFGKLL